MAAPARQERHFVFCALCLSGEVLDSTLAAKQWLDQHARSRHNKYSPYSRDAVQSVTIIYEAVDSEKEQDPSWTDPTGAFMQMAVWMSDRGHL